MRQIVLDTETTGLDPASGHRIIEIGCVEIIDRRLTGNHYHQYIRPDREIDQGAIEVHGITNEFLEDKPAFEAIAEDFVEFIRGAELVIHNAPFDVGFIDAELKRMQSAAGQVANFCQVLDTLVMAREKHPGQKNNLDALCKRYLVDNSQRDLHGALLDAEILADVYLLMTGGQTALSLSTNSGGDGKQGGSEIRRLEANRPRLKVVKANEQELAAHEEKLSQIESKLDDQTLIWRQ
ncbi:DNA polymerase III subunit epsilon [Aurantivibrio infirmus]